MDQGGSMEAESTAGPFASGQRRRSGRLAGGVARAQEIVSRSFERECEKRRFFLWTAVAFAVGSACYFAAPLEPDLLALASASLAFFALSAAGYQTARPWRFAMIVAVALAGATAGKVRVESLIGPEIASPFAGDIVGTVTGRDQRPGRRPRVELGNITIAGVPGPDTPQSLRLSLRPNSELPPVGARISVRARLMPVPGPSVPGAYDPHRAAFFQGIGGSGFAFGEWALVEAPDASRIAASISTVRAAMVDRILAVLPGDTGAIAAALIVGERSRITEEANEALRLAGLAHVLSISGLHMMLIAGTAFFIVRASLAAIPPVALLYPIRKWAALAAIITASFYLALSGGGAATLRAFVMAVILFGAILVDRPAISMRNLALALFVVLALEPEGVFEPGFQMSFAAVAALIAGWESWQSRERLDLAERDLFPGFGLLRAGVAALGATAFTTLIASLATAPFGAFHFERVATYSLLGNLLTMPLVSLLVMPAALVVLVLMPIGLEALPLQVMGLGIDGMLAVARWVAELGGAEIRAPQLGAVSLLVTTGGFLWLTLWTERWRLAGIPVIAIGLVSAPLLHRQADLMITADAGAVAFRDATGILRIAGTREGSFVAEQLLEKETNPPDAGQAGQGFACDATACATIGMNGLTLAYVTDALAFPEECRRADIMVTPLKVPPSCAARLVIDRPSLDKLGAQSIRIGARDGFEIIGEWSSAPRPWQRPLVRTPYPEP